MIKWLKEFWENHGEYIIFVFVVTVFVMIMVFGFFALGKIREKKDSKEYYSGCECGGKWIYDQALGVNSEVRFMYECNKCGTVKLFTKKFKEREEE